jgi:hypothetical protein
MYGWIALLWGVALPKVWHYILKVCSVHVDDCGEKLSFGMWWGRDYDWKKLSFGICWGQDLAVFEKVEPACSFKIYANSYQTA